MEEWHQKLHNNTSPDDVIICQALLDYIDAGLDMSAYWATLKVSATGIDQVHNKLLLVRMPPSSRHARCLQVAIMCSMVAGMSRTHVNASRN